MKRVMLLLMFSVFVMSTACQRQTVHAGSSKTTKATAKTAPKAAKTVVSIPKHARLATFAGGCFWCMQKPFDKLPGVLKTTVGYTGGPEKNPTYKQVAYGRTGHTEAIQVVYDPKKVSYRKLLEVFWQNINPTQVNGQFYDVGKQYRTGIFYHDAKQKVLALQTKKEIEKSGCFSKPIAPEITKATAFYAAEKYHQKYYKKKPYHYMRYRIGSGRDRYIALKWKPCKVFQKK